jgi:hypothetical protein
MTATQPVSNTGYEPVPEMEGDEKKHRRKMARAINQILKGKINVHFDVTLQASQTSTVIQDARIGINSIICPAMAMTADGAAAIAAGIYVDTVLPSLNGAPAQATIHHANSAAADQKIRFLIIN